MRVKFLIPFLMALFVGRVNSQFLYDTLYYKKAYDKAVWSIYQNYYNNAFYVSQSYIKDTAKNSALIINAESLKEIGFSYTKNKEYVAVNLFGLLNDEPKRKPTPKYANCILSYSDRDYLVETGFNWFMGYYEKKSKAIIPKFNDSLPYYNYNKLRTLNTYINSIHFNNSHKFSYNAAYRGTAQQKKSAISSLYFINTNYNRTESDTVIIPFYVRNSYDKFGNLNRLYNLYAAAGVGFSGTLVILKSFFVNLTTMVGPGLQFQKYSFYTTSGFNNRLNVLLCGDARFAFGFNFKQFFITSNSLVNFKYYTLKKVSVTNLFYSNSFSIGYRFNKRKSKNYNN